MDRNAVTALGGALIIVLTTAAVLVNGGTASGAEIVAAALRPSRPTSCCLTARGAAPGPAGGARDLELEQAVEILKARGTAPR